MYSATNYPRNFSRRGGDRIVTIGVLMMALTGIVAAFAFFSASDAFHSFPYLFLVPWIIGLAIVMAVPSLVLYYKGKFSFADPIVFATWSYFFPAFVMGGFFFAFGFSQPYYLAYTQDIPYTLPLTVGLVALGFAGLSVGYFLPIGAKTGAFIGRLLPQANYPPSKYVGPGIVLLALGIFNTIFAFVLGVFGYQKVDQITEYEGLISLAMLFWMQASFLLWNVIFRNKGLSVINVILFILLTITAISKMLYAGNRGSALQVFTVIVLAYVLSGRKLTLRQTVVSGVILTALLLAGMIYGTTFRNIKGAESQVGFSEYTDSIGQTFDEIGKEDSLESLQFGFERLTERLDILTTLSVVVSNYEQLAPYEEAYDLDNNIWKDMTIFLIPRLVWKDKPSASDARKYSDLYFNQSDNSFAITPIGDLLRNFGMVGIFIGMLVIGILLRIFYRALVEEQPVSIWRSMLYFMLLTSVSYEAFYGTIIPSFIKVGFVAVVGILLVNILAKINILPSRRFAN
jgi:hypothetical protein